MKSTQESYSCVMVPKLYQDLGGSTPTTEDEKFGDFGEKRFLLGVLGETTKNKEVRRQTDQGR